MAQIKEHFNRVAAVGCVVCGQAAEIHHATGGSMLDRGVARGMSQKVSDWLVIPLCPTHHRGRLGIHTMTVPDWEHCFGDQAAHLDGLCADLEVDLWAMAKQPKERKYTRPAKVMPR